MSSARRRGAVESLVRFLLRPFVPVKVRPRIETAYYKLRHFGFRYSCPFCDSQLSRFLPLGLAAPVLKQESVTGAGYRRGRCPVCGSADRERLIYLYLLHKTSVFSKPVRLLHVAPEQNLAGVLHKQKNIDYLTAGLGPSGVMVKMDICNIGFPDCSIDVIICNHVLEHIVDDRKAMSELYRTLRRGGWAIVQVPLSVSLVSTYEDLSVTTPWAREEAFGQADHVRIYGQDYRDRLEQVGFRVSVFQWSREAAQEFGGVKNRFALNEDERVYIATRP